MLPSDLATSLERLSQELRTAQTSLESKIAESVRMDREYRLAKARAYLRAEGTNQAIRDSQVELWVDEERFSAKLADGQREAALERLRSLRQEMNAFTSLAYLVKSEVELAR